MLANQLTEVPATVFVDTQAFIESQFNFEGAQLGFETLNLDQQSVSLIMPEITKLEISRHLKKHARASAAKFQSAIDSAYSKHYARSVLSRFDLSRDFPGALETEINGKINQDFLKWMENFNIIEMTFDYCDIAKVFEWRDNFEPPFSTDKPHEYPDAMVLSGLLKYAKERDERVAIISGDPDWSNACKEHPERLEMFSSMAAYVDALGQHSTPYRTEIELLKADDEFKKAVIEELMEATLVLPEGVEGTVDEIRNVILIEQRIYITKTESRWVSVVFDCVVQADVTITREEYRYVSPEIAERPSAPSMAPTLFEETYEMKRKFSIRGRAKVRSPIEEERASDVRRVVLDNSKYVKI